MRRLGCSMRSHSLAAAPLRAYTRTQPAQPASAHVLLTRTYVHVTTPAPVAAASAESPAYELAT